MEPKNKFMNFISTIARYLHIVLIKMIETTKKNKIKKQKKTTYTIKKNNR